MTVADMLDMLDILGENATETDGFVVMVNDALSGKQAELLDVMLDKARGLVLLEVDGRLA